MDENDTKTVFKITIMAIWVFLTKTAKCQLAALVKNTQIEKTVNNIINLL
jgi:hypothetical protein